MIDQKKLEFYIKNNKNVLFIGKHGVGKTSAVIQAFDAANLKWRYYSAATMDPWVDLIGVPKEKTTDDGQSYLDLVRPIEFQNDEVEAIFFDEFNRAPKKVRNAVMELIQFRSINGKKFNRLRMIWAAINPDEEGTYDVEKLDPAQEDRFHIKIHIPYKPYKPYFVSKYGSDAADAAVDWWANLSQKESEVVSPRRLDYALEIFRLQGDMKDVLPQSVNVSKLVSVLHNGSPTKNLRKFYAKKDYDGARQYLAVDNNYNACIKLILSNNKYFEFYFPLLSKEKIATIASKNWSVLPNIVLLSNQHQVIEEALFDVIKAGANKPLIQRLKQFPKFSKKTEIVMGTATAKTMFVKGISPPDEQWLAKLEKELNTYAYSTTYHRKLLIEQVLERVAEVMSLNQAKAVLKVLNAYAKKSHVTTLQRMDIIYFANHCLHIIYNEGKTWKDIEDEFIADYPYLWNKIANSKKMASSMLCP